MGRKLEFNRQKALHAVMESFWAKGYEETSMRELAERLELHLGSVYNALGSKEKVFEEALRLHFDHHILPRLILMTEQSDPLSALDDFMTGVAEECGRPGQSLGCFITNSLHEITKINDTVTAFLHQCLCRTEEAFAVCIARGQAQGSISAARDPYKLARFVVATLFSMRALAKIGVPGSKILDVKDCAMEAIRA